MELTSKHLAALGATPWRPGTDHVRYYLDDWPALIGLEVVYYHTGNIRSATLRGEHISNAEAYRMGANQGRHPGQVVGRVWLDRYAHLHYDAMSDRAGSLVCEAVDAIIAATDRDAECNATAHVLAELDAAVTRSRQARRD